ncbi:MAG: Mitochondrial ATPase complex subunit atp10 [Vezdaea aestivalis]|nr:MAG: Mitochondrial ATPase complex subunit atp10 [Vezdaea aestivalis]
MASNTVIPTLNNSWALYTCRSCRSKALRQTFPLRQSAPGQRRGILGILRPPPDFVPKPLSKPVGLSEPPRAGENSGLEERSWRQRASDYFDKDNSIERTQKLAKQYMEPYFKDTSNLKWQEGKSYLQPKGIFKASRSLYFPNLRGQTLSGQPNEGTDGMTDTTTVLEGRVTILAIFQGTWAQEQTATFIDEKFNPNLWNILRGNRGITQLVQINFEEKAMRYAVLQMCLPRMRNTIPKDIQGSYFLMRKGLTQEIRESMGYLNSKVGYIFVIDRSCRIRWAASAKAGEDEIEGLNKVVRRLLHSD